MNNIIHCFRTYCSGKSFKNAAHCFRTSILVIACLLLPGCADNIEYSDHVASATGIISDGNVVPHVLKCLNIDPLFLFLMAVNLVEDQTNEVTRHENDDHNANASGDIHKNDNTNDESMPGKQRTNTLQHFPHPAPALADQQHLDEHDNNEEENTIHINFPRLMRIAIVLLLTILLI